MDELRQLLDQVGDVSRAVTEIRDKGGNVETELRRAVGELAETQKQVQALEGQMLVEAEHRDKLEQQIAEMATASGRTKAEVADEHHEVFRDFLRYGFDPNVSGQKSLDTRARYYGMPGMEELHKRALSEGNIPEGGALVSPTIESGIVKDVVEMSPVMQVARVTTITGAWWEKTKRTATPTAYWVGEQARPTESNSEWGILRITPGIAAAATEVSTPLLDDAGGVESEIAQDAAEAIDALLGAAMVTGNGVGKPRGFTIPGDVPFVTGTDTSAHNVAADDFYNLLYGKGSADQSGLSARYRANATFAFNSNTLLAAVKLKDDQNNYIWQDGFRDGAFTRIAGRPYVVFEDMADDGSADLLAVALADWSAFYRVIIRRGIYLIRDIYSAKPNVEFDWYMRIGGDVVQAQAGRLLKMG